MTEQPEPTLQQMVFELGLALGRDAAANGNFELFICGCNPEKVDVAQLRTTLAHCRSATERLAALYHLLQVLVPYEAEVREIADRARKSTKSGQTAAA